MTSQRSKEGRKLTSGKAEPFNDDRAEVRDPAVDDTLHHRDEEERVELVIRERLPDLVRLQRLVLHPRLVLAQPLDGHLLLVVREPLGGDRTVGYQEEHDCAPDAAQSAYDQELVLPARERAPDVADAVAEEATERNADAVCRVPETNLNRLLSSGAVVDLRVSTAQ